MNRSLRRAQALRVLWGLRRALRKRWRLRASLPAVFLHALRLCRNPARPPLLLSGANLRRRQRRPRAPRPSPRAFRKACTGSGRPAHVARTAWTCREGRRRPRRAPPGLREISLLRQSTTRNAWRGCGRTARAGNAQASDREGRALANATLLCLKDSWRGPRAAKAGMELSTATSLLASWQKLWRIA